MPKTNEEIQKVLGKNYKNVQSKELEVYESNGELNKSFDKEVTSLQDGLKQNQKINNKSEKEMIEKFKSQLTEIKNANTEAIKAVEMQIESAEVTYETSLSNTNEKHSLETENLNKKIAVIKKDNEKLIASVLKQYNIDIDNAKKTIAEINEKGVKDQATFEQKIEDLKAKHIQKVEDYNDKEKIKIEKISESANKKVEKLQELIESERVKLDAKLVQLTPMYEEELAEIDENIENAKFEYETKHESIRSSADQRIAVREKHMHRAMDDNDQRSVKLHKKDIEKFRKEADRDLVLLRKKFSQENLVAADYRKNFIKENFQKIAEMEREYSRMREAKQNEIDDLLIILATDVENTKLDNEKVIAEELQKFNVAYSEVKEKQLNIAKVQELDLEMQDSVQIKLEIEFNKTNDINLEKFNESIEFCEKKLRDTDINKVKEDLLSKYELDNANFLLTNEKDIYGITLEKDILVNAQNKKIESHNIQYLRHVMEKEEFLAYQNTLVPLYTSRANNIHEYEELEAKNRNSLKIAFLEAERLEINKDLEKVVSKINAVYEQEKIYFNQEITRIAGAEKEAYETYLEAGEEKLGLLKSKYAGIRSKDKKAKRAALEELELFESKFNNEKTEKQTQLDNSIKAYSDALKQAESRKNIALNEVKQLNEAENNLLNNAIDLANSHLDSELENVQKHLSETESNINEFINQAGTRNQDNSNENQLFLDIMIANEQQIINDGNNDFEAKREVLNSKLNSNTVELSTAKDTALNDIANQFANEERKLEEYKAKITSKIADIDKKTDGLLSDQTIKTNENNKGIESKTIGLIKEITDQLAVQSSEHNSHLQEIIKKVSAEKSRFESEKKRIQKEFDQRLKEDLHNIDNKLSTDISSLK